MIILNTLNSKEGYRRRIPLDQGLIQKGPHRWFISAQGRGPLSENSQLHRANFIVSHGAVDDLNIKDDTVVVNWPECAYGLDERCDVEELLSAEMRTTRDRSGRLGITLVVVLAVQQRSEARVANVHDCLDGGMSVLLLRVTDDGHFGHGEGETIRNILLDSAECVLVLLGEPHLAHAVLSGILR